MRFLVHPYRPDSAGCRKLIAALGEGASVFSRPYTAQAGDCVISWGAGDANLPTGALNKKITAIINKMDFFVRLRDTNYIPDFRTTRGGAESLKFPVFCRTTIEGKDGVGIVVAENVSQLVQAPLYVEFIQKTAEYRVHVGRFADGTLTVIGSQKKTFSFDGTGDQRIWAGDGAHLSDEWDTAPAAVTECVLGAFKKFPEVTFAGFDVIYNSQNDTAFVLEANTAPMMTPTTTKRYAQFFKDYVARRDGKPVAEAPTPVVAQPVIDTPTSSAPSARPAWAVPAKSAPPTKENVIWLLDNEMLSLDTIIEGYIKNLQEPE